MRKLRTPIALFCAIAAGLAAIAADGLSQLGLTPAATKEAIGTIVSAGVYNPGLPAKAFKLLPPAARVQAVTSAAAWVKAYTATPEFKAQYDNVRKSHRPDGPPAWTTTPEQELQKADDEQKKQLDESKQALAGLPAETRKAVEDGMKAAAEMTAKMNTPEMRKVRLDTIKADRAGQTKSYEAELAKWKQDYPDDPKPVIARRLKEFLALSADVDYNAKLANQGDISTFANPAYQSKASQWKMCYRAGKEATDAARAAAQAWLKELGG
jgi:hypothetical protein